jgi:hypothetical protein
VGLEPDPVAVAEALARPDAHAWKPAIDDELASLMQHNCWTLVTLLPGVRAVGSRLILEHKRDLRYKARLVAHLFLSVLALTMESRMLQYLGTRPSVPFSLLWLHRIWR